MMHRFEKQVKCVIEREGLLRPGAPVIVGLSGGADSVALLAVLNELGYECIAAHCNFHLRGAESVRDMRHAESIARKLGVNIYIKEFNVGERMQRTGESVEMACRELRYSWFHELLDRDFSQAVAVGHHKEDNVETFFLNLLRSSGLRGLTGMDFRRGYIIRPLLELSRNDIENYLKDKGLTYVVDSSNESNIYRRNILRNEVLPNIREHFAEAEESVLAAMRHLSDARRIVDHAIKLIADEYVGDHDILDVGAVVARYNNDLASAFLFELLYPQGFTSTQIENLIDAVSQGHSGVRFELPQDVVAELDRGILSYTSRKSLDRQAATYTVGLRHDILVPVHIEVSEHDIVEFNPVRNNEIIYLDKRALSGDCRFEIRHPRTGDRMRPFGMNGERLVSDILKDAKYTAAQKREVWLLTRNGTVLWVIGLRASQHFSVNPDTRRYLELRYKKS